MLPPSPPELSRTDDRHREPSRLTVLAEGVSSSEQIDLPGAASATRRTGSDLPRTGQAQSGLRACGLHRCHPSRAVPTVTESAEQPFPILVYHRTPILWTRARAATVRSGVLVADE
jgi:hypothetical protein